jgi:hypothetical protein
MSTTQDMPSLSPDPGFEYYYKACRKGDPEAKAVTVNESPVAALVRASEIAGLSLDNFEIHDISKEEFKRLQ